MPKVKPGIVDVYIGERLREIRVRQDETQEATGRAIQVTIQQVQKFENGNSRISASQLHELAKFFGADVQLFLPRATITSAKRERSAESDREAEAAMEFAVSRSGTALLRADASSQPRYAERIQSVCSAYGAQTR